MAAAEKDCGAAIGAADFGRGGINVHAANRVFAGGDLAGWSAFLVLRLGLWRSGLVEFVGAVIRAEPVVGVVFAAMGWGIGNLHLHAADRINGVAAAAAEALLVAS